jgi:hypothetical protein
MAKKLLIYQPFVSFDLARSKRERQLKMSQSISQKTVLVKDVFIKAISN